MLKKVVILLFVSIAFSLQVFSFSEDILSELEYTRYGISYENESLGDRLNRLETDYFGMAQTGDINSRLKNLSRINMNARNGVNQYSNNIDNYYNTNTGSGIRNLWNSIKSTFGNNGYITGYTPSMNTIDLYNSNPNNYMNMPNSFNNYYPGYNNRTNRILPRYFRQSDYINGVNNPYPRRVNPRHRYNNNHYNPYNYTPTNRTVYYSPPNVQTKSSIHILND